MIHNEDSRINFLEKRLQKIEILTEPLNQNQRTNELLSMRQEFQRKMALLFDEHSFAQQRMKQIQLDMETLIKKFDERISSIIDQRPNNQPQNDLFQFREDIRKAPSAEQDDLSSLNSPTDNKRNRMFDNFFAKEVGAKEANEKESEIDPNKDIEEELEAFLRDKEEKDREEKERKIRERQEKEREEREEKEREEREREEREKEQKEREEREREEREREEREKEEKELELEREKQRKRVAFVEFSPKTTGNVSKPEVEDLLAGIDIDNSQSNLNPRKQNWHELDPLELSNHNLRDPNNNSAGNNSPGLINWLPQPKPELKTTKEEEEQLQELAVMGFDDRERNLRLLQKYKHLTKEERINQIFDDLF